MQIYGELSDGLSHQNEKKANIPVSLIVIKSGLKRLTNVTRELTSLRDQIKRYPLSLELAIFEFMGAFAPCVIR